MCICFTNPRWGFYLLTHTWVPETNTYYGGRFWLPISHFSFPISHFSFPISHFSLLISYFSLPISRFYFRFRCHFLLPLSFPALSAGGVTSYFHFRLRRCRPVLASYFSLLTSYFSLLISYFSLLISYFSLLISYFSLLISYFSLLISYFSLPISRFYFRFRCHFLLPLSFPALSGFSLVVSRFLVLVSTTPCDIGTGARCFTFFDLPVERNQSGFWT